MIELPRRVSLNDKEISRFNRNYNEHIKEFSIPGSNTISLYISSADVVHLVMDNAERHTKSFELSIQDVQNLVQALNLGSKLVAQRKLARRLSGDDE